MPFDGKDENKRRLIKSVGTVLARDGFNKLGVNSVSREAGVDKVLIYRYFGGLHQLVNEFCETIEFWPDVEELIGQDEDKLNSMNAEEQLVFFFKRFIKALRSRPTTQMIMVWWDTEPNGQLAEHLDDIRMRTALEFFERLENIPFEKDLTAVVLILYAAISNLIVKSQTGGFVGGIDLKTDSGWQRIEDGIELLIGGVFRE